MTNHIIDNTLKNLGKTVLWQYDKAVRLLSVMKYMQVLYHCAVEQLWNAWVNKVLSIDNCGVFGCSIWGSFLGVPRPTIVDNKGKTRLIATSVYRKLLKGAFYLMKTGCSYEEILGYLEIVFGVSGDDALSKWKGSCSEYGWYINLDELNDKYEPGASYEKGYVFWNNPQGDADPLGANWKCLKDITSEENTSWEAIARYVRETPDPTTRSMTEDTLLLKLYDPENVIRKIGGAPRNALSISLSYTFGDTVITAEVERRRKCGVMLIDNGDMTMEYKESPYYEDMHQDQRYLFEQRKEEFCPYPLGVKTNEPPEEWVFGFGSLKDSLPQYKEKTYFAEGVRFWVFNQQTQTEEVWETKEYLDIWGNRGFDYIKGKCKKIGDIPQDEPGQQCAMYEPNKAYAKDEIFAAEASTSPSVWKHFKCKEDISISENTSFEAIENKLEVTSEGDPLVCGLVEVNEQYMSYPLGIDVTYTGESRYIGDSQLKNYAPMPCLVVLPKTLTYTGSLLLLNREVLGELSAILRNLSVPTLSDTAMEQDIIAAIQEGTVLTYQESAYYLVPFFWIPFNYRWKVGGLQQVVRIDEGVSTLGNFMLDRIFFFSSSVITPNRADNLSGSGISATSAEFIRYVNSNKEQFYWLTNYVMLNLGKDKFRRIALTTNMYMMTKESYDFVNNAAYDGMVTLEKYGKIKVQRYSNSELMQYNKAEKYEGTPNFIVRGEKMCLKNGELVPAAITTFISKKTQERLGIN